MKLSVSEAVDTALNRQQQAGSQYVDDLDNRAPWRRTR
jgi:hypothetical protein